jgi:hypothetical protein
VSSYRGLRQTLVFGGDDTLRENNGYFERAIDDVIGATTDRRSVRAAGQA